MIVSPPISSSFSVRLCITMSQLLLVRNRTFLLEVLVSCIIKLTDLRTGYVNVQKLCNVQGSVHRKYIPFDIYLIRGKFTVFYLWKTSLHVSGGIFTHHQEHTQLYLQYLVLVNRYCYLPLLWESWSWSECGVGIGPICDVCHRSVQFPHHIQTSSNSPTIEADSSNG